MKNSKKILSTVIALSIGISSSVFGEMPRGTVVIGDKAYDIRYVNRQENLFEITSIMNKSGADVYIKGGNGKWYELLSEEVVSPELLSRVRYKDANGNFKDYGAKDGEEIFLKVSSADFIKDNEARIRFTKKVDEESALDPKNYKIENEELGEDCILSLSEDGQTVIITFAKKIKEENSIKKIDVSAEILDINKNKMADDFNREVFVINDSDSLKTNTIEGDVNIVVRECSLENMNFKGDVYVFSDNVEIKNTKIKNMMVDQQGDKGTITLKGESEIGNTLIKNNTLLDSIKGSFGSITVDIENHASAKQVELKGKYEGDILLKSPVKLISSKGASIAKVQIEADNISLDGNFMKVEVNQESKLMLSKNTMVDKLIAKKNVVLDGEKGAKVNSIFADGETEINAEDGLKDGGFKLPDVRPVDEQDTETTTPTTPSTPTPQPQPDKEYKPVAKEVSLEGTLKVGEVLFGEYKYSDKDGDEEGDSTFKWYRSDAEDGREKSEIIGATDRSYTLKDEDEGKYISFEVTPVAKTGEKTGESVISGFRGPVEEKDVVVIDPVKIEIAGHSVTIIVEDVKVQNDATIRIFNSTTGKVVFIDQLKSQDNKVVFNAGLGDSGKYTVIINAYGEGEELIIRPIEIE